MQSVEIGAPPWTRAEMRASLREFAELYERRPIRQNTGGMRSPHMFLAWFAMRALQPSAIVESGVWLGQGTWLFEQACPGATIHCIDLNLDRIQYRSARARYYNQDFTRLDWRDLPRESTVLFFDDHQDAYRRLIAARWFGFRHVLFEDNYPPARGDCYSLKTAFLHAGFQPARRKSLRSRVRDAVAALLSIETPAAESVAPNSGDAQYLREHLAVYCELPPIFQVGLTRWGDPWEGERYATPEPLLSAVEEPYQQLFLDEAASYTWMCYARLRVT